MIKLYYFFQSLKQEAAKALAGKKGLLENEWNRVNGHALVCDFTHNILLLYLVSLFVCQYVFVLLRRKCGTQKNTLFF